jgi:hypothetical protein
MSNWWIRFGCFLTGYNYTLVMSSSEVTAKAVKRYTSALIIVCVLWAFIGFVFTKRYLFGNLFACIAGASIMVLIIIQIERQIIMSITPNRLLYFARGLIAFLMAIIGSIIIDQIIFKQDIELEKIPYIEEKVQKILPSKSEQLRTLIAAENSEIMKLDSERVKDIEEVSKKPLIKSISTQTLPQKVTELTRDASGNTHSTEKIIQSLSVITTSIPNPKQSIIPVLNLKIDNLKKEKLERENALLNIRPQLEAEFKSKIGFLDELNIMFRLISNSAVALIVWLIWFLFLMGLELLVLVSKSIELKNDYDDAILHQMALKRRKLEALSKSLEE